MDIRRWWCRLSSTVAFMSGPGPLVVSVFARWADAGTLWHALVASVAHLATEKPLDLRVLYGDGTNTVAPQGGMALATRATSPRKGSKSAP